MSFSVHLQGKRLIQVNNNPILTNIFSCKASEGAAAGYGADDNAAEEDVDKQYVQFTS